MHSHLGRIKAKWRILKESLHTWKEAPNGSLRAFMRAASLHDSSYLRPGSRSERAAASVLGHLYGHLGCFHVLAINNSAVMNIGVHVSLSLLVSSVCMPSSGIAGPKGMVWGGRRVQDKVLEFQL